jgi:hypothetical protein
MSSLKTRLLILLTILAMLFAVSSPAIADHDGFDDDNGAIQHPGWDDDDDNGDDEWWWDDAEEEEEFDEEEFEESEESSDWCTDLWWELWLLGVDPWAIWEILEWWDCI